MLTRAAQPKYWCKHCSGYVKDTPFERKQHENTGKHQGNLRRFLRDIQNSHERDERDKQRAKSEVERLKGVAAGDTKTNSSLSQVNAKLTRPTTGPQSTADRKRQWAQLAEMGVKVPEGFRSEMAMAGDWHIATQSVVDQTSSETSLSVGVRKRKCEGQEEKEAASEAVVQRDWGAATRTYPGRDNVGLDNLLSSSIRVKSENTDTSKSHVRLEEQQSAWAKHNLAINQDESGAGNYTSHAKLENQPEDTENDRQDLVKKEIESKPVAHSLGVIPEEAPIPVFKRRKAKAS